MLRGSFGQLDCKSSQSERCPAPWTATYIVGMGWGTWLMNLVIIIFIPILSLYIMPCREDTLAQANQQIHFKIKVFCLPQDSWSWFGQRVKVSPAYVCHLRNVKQILDREREWTWGVVVAVLLLKHNRVSPSDDPTTTQAIKLPIGTDLE